MLARFRRFLGLWLLLAAVAQAAVTTTFAISTTSTSNAGSYATGSFTPVLGDLLVTFAVCSGSTAAGSFTESIAEVTFTTVSGGSALYNSSASIVLVGVANAKLPSATARTVTYTTSGGNATGCVVVVYREAGMARVGAAAIKQKATTANGAAAGTPAVTFGGSVLTTNVTLGTVGNATSPATLTPPTGWTEDADNGYSTPTTGSESVHRDSGFASTTITWGSTSASVFGVVAVELDTSVPPCINTILLLGAGCS